MPLTTWDPAHKNAGITLSGGNLAATSSAGSGTVNQAVYATTAISSTDKQYFEVTITGTTGQYLSIGVMNGSASLSANVGATNGVGLVNRFTGGSTTTYLNGVGGGTGYPAFVSGQTVRVAIDRAANKIWWAVNNNSWSGGWIWMGSGTTGDDPATGAGGFSISTVTGTIYPAVSSAWTGDVATINGGSAAFAYAVPSGFVALDGAPATAKQYAVSVIS